MAYSPFSFSLTDRCVRMRDDAVNVKSMAPLICAQHSFWYRWGRAHAEPHHSFHLSAANGIASVIRNSRVSALIGEDELLVGYNFGDGDHWGLTGNAERDRAILRENGFSDEQIAWYFDPSVQIPDGEWVPLPPDDAFTKEQRELRAEDAAMNSAGPWCLHANHSVIGFRELLEVGFEGLLERVNQWANKNGESDFYAGLRMICEAGCTFGDRWADEAERIGRSDIAAVCRNVPRHGAKNFREAVQSLWFGHIINTWEDDINANSLGRLDQILYPYYRHDIDAGILTNEEAFELICCLWIKLYRDYDVQQSCVGGTSPDGSSDVNELSWMMLEATEQLNFVRCLSVRFSERTEPEFLERALQVVGRIQKGVPFFFNDDVMIPALISVGIDPADAYDYTQIGCVETVIPGKSNPHAVNSRTNLLKALEYALNNGGSGINPDFRPGLATGDAASFADFDTLYDAVRQQIAHMIRATVDIAVAAMPATCADFAHPVKSLLTKGCLESGRDINNGGAIYDYYQLMLVGVPNLADSLAAIRTLVYEKHRYTMEELLAQLAGNWPDEAMRMEFVTKSPKYGNDIDEVDNLAADIIDYACDCIEAESARVGHSFHAQPFTFLWMIDHGRKCAASADGRRDGEILAYSLSPMQGRDKEGLSALLNSIAKMPQKRTPGTTSAIVEVDPVLFREENLPVLTDLLLGAASMGLGNVQFNTVDAETLIDAQIHPENHRNLAVRVSGFSQKFNLLGRELQDHIIARTKHAAV